ncbi:MAG TPA: CapA family protein [Candidatus Dormibacteraeota bacterium]|nr:CapA family protein [Candidatus Dormibacteraeota bacterium]
MLIAGVGDLVVMKRLLHVRRPPAESLLPVLMEADYVVGNLEVPLTSVDNPQRDDIVLRGDPALIPDVAALGIDAVSVANNHCGDHGWVALRGMADDLRRSGVTPLGIGDNLEEALAPVVRQVSGTGVALVTATCVALEQYLATEDRPGMAGVRITTSYEPDEGRLAWEPATPPRIHTVVKPEDEARLLAAVSRARRLAPAVVAVVHWGVSWADRPEGYQRELGRKLVESGACAVLGCHSHTVQGVEVHRGAPIFYGLGSFVFGYEGPLAARMPRDSAVALLDVEPSGRVTRARLLLGRLDGDGEPVRAHPERAALLAEIVARNSAGWGAPTQLEGDTLTIGSLGGAHG